MSGARRTVGAPHDRLTRLCDAMTSTLVRHPEYGADVRCVVFLQNDERGGLQLHGYNDDVEAVADVLLHLRAIFEANGKTLIIAPLAKG